MDTTDLFNDPRLTAMGLLFEAHAGLIAKMEPAWKEHDLSGLDLNAMLRLSRSPGQRLRMTDLATQTMLSTSGVTRLVDRLQRSGLVRREFDPADRRSTYAALTAEGAERLQRVLPGYLDTIEHWFTGLLNPEQLQALVGALRIIRDATNPNATAQTQGTEEAPYAGPYDSGSLDSYGISGSELS